MIPGNRLSTQAVGGDFLYPDDQDTGSLLVAYELGGIALNDGSQGRMVQPWKAEVLGTGIYLGALEGTPAPVLWYTAGTGVTTVDLAFDNNMQPVVAWMQDGVAKFRWYDTIPEEFTVTTLPGAVLSIRCFTDDKRAQNNSDSDVYVVYNIGTTLYARRQRDRYTIEYNMGTVSLGTIRYAGMANTLRIQFLIDPS